MDVGAVIVEQLEADGSLRTFRMQADHRERITVAFADEYHDRRSGPFHFLDDRHERRYARAFAECKVRRLSSTRFSCEGGQYRFRTSWAGIPTDDHKFSYYAVCLPEYATPQLVRFTDPRTRREYTKAVVRDDQRRRFVLYLECAAPGRAFDFALEALFRIDPAAFTSSTFGDETSLSYGAHLDAYEYVLPESERNIVQQFFTKELFMGDKYNVSGQVGAVGPNSHISHNTFSQQYVQAAAGVDLPTLAKELAVLRASMRKEAIDIDHDQAIASIGAAEAAAKNRDGSTAIEHLKSAGKWALDIATKIGTGVAAKAIETAMGL